MNDAQAASGIIERFGDALTVSERVEIAKAGVLSDSEEHLSDELHDRIIELFTARKPRDEKAAHEKAWAKRKRASASVPHTEMRRADIAKAKEMHEDSEKRDASGRELARTGYMLNSAVGSDREYIHPTTGHQVRVNYNGEITHEKHGVMGKWQKAPKSGTLSAPHVRAIVTMALRQAASGIESSANNIDPEAGNGWRRHKEGLHSEAAAIRKRLSEITNGAQVEEDDLAHVPHVVLEHLGI